MRHLIAGLIAGILVAVAWPAGASEERHPARLDVHSENPPARAAESATSGKVGPEEAVVAADPVQGIQLSEKAKQRIGLSLMPIHEGTVLTVPKSALVYSEDQRGVYRYRDGWLKFIPGQTQPEGSMMRFKPRKPDDLKTGDQLAVTAVPLIHITQDYVFSAEEGE